MQLWFLWWHRVRRNTKIPPLLCVTNLIVVVKPNHLVCCNVLCLWYNQDFFIGVLLCY